MSSKYDQSYHHALHLAHRWFTFFEAPVGNLEQHLLIFHPQVCLTGHQGQHLFANDLQSLKHWFHRVPNELSSHFILHSDFEMAENGDGLLSMLVAYQAVSDSSLHGSIIRYETRIEFKPEGARFITLDKTPILPNRKAEFEHSWAINRVLARIHADLAGITATNERTTNLIGKSVRQLDVHTNADSSNTEYKAILTCSYADHTLSKAFDLSVFDDGDTDLPTIHQIYLMQP